MERGRHGGRDARAPGGYLSLCSSTNSYTKFPVPAASENSLMTTPLAQPAPAPVPGVAVVVAPMFQFEVMFAAGAGGVGFCGSFSLGGGGSVGAARVVAPPVFFVEFFL